MGAMRMAGRAALLAGSLLLTAATGEDAIPFDPRLDAAFGDARPALRQFLARAVPRPRGGQHFCIIAYRGAGWSNAWMHWREGRMLVLWEGRGEPGYPDDSIAHSRRQLDLTRDVVPTPDDINGSTYLIDRPWLNRTLADCRAHGVSYTVMAPPRDREGGE